MGRRRLLLLLLLRGGGTPRLRGRIQHSQGQGSRTGPTMPRAWWVGLVVLLVVRVGVLWVGLGVEIGASGLDRRQDCSLTSFGIANLRPPLCDVID